MPWPINSYYADMESPVEQKLFYHLYEKVITRRIRTFAQLAKYIKGIRLPENFDPSNVLLRVFLLIKELHWGFFKELDRDKYSKLWKELVVSHDRLKNAGDLKRNISVSNIYVAMLDIHGYTRFCQESKSNLSRLRQLDEFLHSNIKTIAGNNHALAARERGDEIVVVAASATDIIKTTLEMINSLSKRSVIKDGSVERHRGNYSIILPDFKVTAGIAGGNLTTPLIITESGLLSGFLMNTAARLQSRANELSPDESKVMVAQSLYTNYLKENKLVASVLYVKKLVHFLNNGPVAFKGLSLMTYEVIFKQGERYRLKYQAKLNELYNSLKQELWRQKIFSDLLAVIGEACRHMPPFQIEFRENNQQQIATNTTIIRFCNKAGQLYEIEDDYISALAVLGQILDQLRRIDHFDKLVMDYATEIHDRYTELLAVFEQRLEGEIDKKIDSIFTQQYKMAYYNARKNAETYQKLKAHARKSKELANKKSIWYSLLEEHRERLKLRIYSGKK